ncbi:MAG: hypothetical protein ABSG17_18445 [Spirochaetia bacterium]|jgi:hypothetical protein
MSQKLARAAVFAASLILAASRIAFPSPLAHLKHDAKSPCIVAQLPARR